MNRGFLDSQVQSLVPAVGDEDVEDAVVDEGVDLGALVVHEGHLVFRGEGVGEDEARLAPGSAAIR